MLACSRAARLALGEQARVPVPYAMSSDGWMLYWCGCLTRALRGHLPGPGLRDANYVKNQE